MTLQKALNQVEKEYADALKNEHIRKPLAYALYQVWKMADTDERKPTSLDGKCGSCFFAKPTTAFGGSKSYVQCTNAEHMAKWQKHELSHVRQRTCKACKLYERRVSHG